MENRTTIVVHRVEVKNITIHKIHKIKSEDPKAQLLAFPFLSHKPLVARVGRLIKELREDLGTLQKRL
jgi:hypothetical protein